MPYVNLDAIYNTARKVAPSRPHAPRAALMALLRHIDPLSRCAAFSVRGTASDANLTPQQFRSALKALSDHQVIRIHTTSTGSVAEFIHLIPFLENDPMTNKQASSAQLYETGGQLDEVALKLVQHWNELFGRPRRSFMANELGDQNAFIILLRDGETEAEIRKVMAFMKKNNLLQYCPRPAGLIKALREVETACRYDQFQITMEAAQEKRSQSNEEPFDVGAFMRKAGHR